ncbi:MFS transporter [Sporosarcina obsidiansis]|uniref:MFS transporter n=1 Tax=Sporosarcina obsidiansis TaxID=2660748 RepID=UPI001890DB2D|nr:MFS transporter [Sporosarcina obsidiansis]
MVSLTGRKRKVVIMILLFVGMIISFFDRLAINVAAIPIEKEFGLNPSQVGLLISAFFISYSLMQPLGGWLTDKYGPRILIVISLASWSIFTAMTGLAWSFASLLFIRFLFGIGEGPFHSAAVASIHENFPEKERGRANSFFLSAQGIGGVLGSVAAAAMVVALGWRGMFVSLGVVGVFVALIFWIVLKPSDAQATSTSIQHKKKVPLRLIFKIDNIWKIIFAKFFSNVVSWGLVSWMPIYLVKERGIDLVSAGGLMAIPYISSFLIMNLSGWLLDKVMVRREKYLIGIGSLLAAVFLYCMSIADSVTLFITFFTFASISISFIGTGLFTIVLKYGPKELIGSVTGLVTFSGQIAGAVSPVVIGLIISLFNGSYDAAFWFLVASAILAAISSLTIKNEKNDTSSPEYSISKTHI